MTLEGNRDHRQTVAVPARVGHSLNVSMPIEAILEGRQPVELTAARLKRIRLPHAWADQRRVVGFTV